MRDKVRIVHRGGTVRTCDFLKLDLSGKSPVANIRWGMAGIYQVNLTHGWLESPADDWRLEDADLEALRAECEAQGKTVWPMPRSTGRPRKQRGPVKAHPKQTRFQGGGF